MNKLEIIMKKFQNIVAGAMVAFFLLVAFAATVPTAEATYMTCSVSANTSAVDQGGSIVLTWAVEGFTEVTINGEQVDFSANSKTYTNIQTDQSYRLVATNDNGDTCTQTVSVECLETAVEPVAPVCKIAPAANRTIVDFKDARLFSSKSERYAVSNDVAAALEAGTYEVTLMSWDGYLNRVNTSQPNEQWQVDFVKSGSVIAASGVTRDLADNVVSAQLIQKVDDGLVLSETVDSVRAVHSYYPDTSSANSVVPICAAFDLVSTPEPIEGCTDTDATNYDSEAEVDDSSCVYPEPAPEPQFCELTLDKSVNKITAIPGEELTYTITIKNTGNADCTGGGVKIVDHINPNLTFLNYDISSNLTAGYDGDVYQNGSLYFNGHTLVPGEIGTITWTGRVEATAACGDYTVYNEAKATALELDNFNTWAYSNKVETAIDYDCETQSPVPSCDTFTVTPNTVAAGGDITLTWETTDATEVLLNNGIGAVAIQGTTTVSNLTADTTYTLTTNNSFGSDSCSVTVAVETEAPYTCGDLTFTASVFSINRGTDVTLSWDAADADSVSISVINEDTLSGSTVVSPTQDTNYVLTANRGDETINCPVAINVSTGGGGGGGGGGTTPRCEFEASDSRISAGEKISLEWETRNTNEITVTDDRGNVIFTTDDYLSTEKRKYYDYEIEVKPTRDTTYTLLAERGRRDRECTVEVEVERGGGSGSSNKVIVLETRDQQPLVTGISMTEVPYTGFKSGLALTIVFYVLLVTWALYVTYLLVVRKKIMNAGGPASILPQSAMASMRQAEQIRPDVFAPVSAPVKTFLVENLPVNTETSDRISDTNEAPSSNNELGVEATTVIENHAHTKRALLSSDAMRFFVGNTNTETRMQNLDSIIAEAKVTYPLEEGWVVINEDRLRSLISANGITSAIGGGKDFTPTVMPEGTGSLAEAIVSGNIVAAYDMVGNRPMFALADAAADLDSLYRKRQGSAAVVSDLLEQSSVNLSEDQIKKMISSLTGALDGTYSDESSAVKMAIMKAIKEVV